MNFHKLARLMYKPDKLQLRTSHYKGVRGIFRHKWEFVRRGLRMLLYGEFCNFSEIRKQRF